MDDKKRIQVLLNETSSVERSEEGRIVIKLFVKEDTALITVKDNGGGISEAIKGNLFKPYVTTKNKQKGSGLGLYIAKMIIEDHMDGHLFVENTNDGALFTIELKCKCDALSKMAYEKG